MQDTISIYTVVKEKNTTRHFSIISISRYTNIIKKIGGIFPQLFLEPFFLVGGRIFEDEYSELRSNSTYINGEA
jgi:hypothetical protein